MAEGVGQIHIAPFFVHHTTVLLQPQQHSLQSLGRCVELLYKDLFQRFVVSFHVQYVNNHTHKDQNVRTQTMLRAVLFLFGHSAFLHL